MADPLSMQVKRGATLTFVLEAYSGDVSSFECFSAIKVSPGGDDLPELALLTTTYMPHIDVDDNASNPGWNITLDASVTANFLGDYAIDTKIVDGAYVIQTDTIQVAIVKRITQTGA